MSTAGLQPDAAWLAALRERASLPPRAPREPLWAGGVRIGSVEVGFLDEIALQPSWMLREVLQKSEQIEDDTALAGWALQGEINGALARLADVLRATGRCGVWRDELLAVTDVQGHRVGLVERGVVRPLGITTHAVHLVGRNPLGHHWVQRRALTKANDPGLWDTLMGGMVSAADTLEQALARETWEEAGLRLTQLQGVRAGGRVTIRRPSPDGLGSGYMEEHIDWFTGVVPDGVVPVNQDGEVAQFACLGPAEMLERLQRDAFTLEAALITCAAGL